MVRICCDYKIRILSEKLVDGHPNSPLTAWDALALGSTLWWCFNNNFLSPIPSLNYLKFTQIQVDPHLKDNYFNLNLLV